MTDLSNSTLKQATFKNGLILALFALISTGLIALTHLITKDKIAQEIEAALARRLNEIIPANEYNNDVYHDCQLVKNAELLGSSEALKIYRMRNNNNHYAVLMSTTAPEGYSGKIKLVVGIYQNGEIAGVRVTEHTETPGLGDKIEIEKSNWIKQFNGKSLNNTATNLWRVKKDGGNIDALTGATITPRAIIKAVYKTLLYFEQNNPKIFDPNQNCEEQND